MFSVRKIVGSFVIAVTLFVSSVVAFGAEKPAPDTIDESPSVVYSCPYCDRMYNDRYFCDRPCYRQRYGQH